MNTPGGYLVRKSTTVENNYSPLWNSNPLPHMFITVGYTVILVIDSWCHVRTTTTTATA